MKHAFLFPGQGSQCPNMLHQLPAHPEVAALLQEANEILGGDVLLYDQAEQLQSTVAVQISLFLSGVATARVLRAEDVVPDMAAGHSVGAFAAAVVAGALPFEEALLLVKLRGELMEQAFPQGYGMGVVLGMNERQLTSIVGKLTAPEAPVFVANVNAPDQIVVSGSLSGLERLLATVRTAGARKAKLLNVSVPSHCPLMKQVAAEFAKALEPVSFSNPRIPYAGNFTTRPLRAAQAIREDLANSISSPVRWHEITTLFYEMGARLFIEMLPGHVLTDLAAQTFSGARAISISEKGIRSAVILTERMKNQRM